MEVFSTDLPADFHAVKCVEGYGIVVVADSHVAKVYKTTRENFIEYYDISQRHEFTTLYCSEPTGFLHFGDMHGQATVWSFYFDDPHFTKQIIDSSTPVTALVDGYIAHNQIVSKLAPAVFGDDDSIVTRLFEHRVTVPRNEPVTFMHKFENTLLCFAGNNIYQYNASTLQNYFANGIGPIERGSLLCLAHDKYVVYPTGFYKLFDYDGEKFNHLEIIEEFNDGDDDVKAVSACAFGNYVAILFDNLVLSISTELGNRMRQVAYIEVEALGQLCGPRRGHEFTLVTRDKIIRYSLSGQEVSASEGSDSSSDSSDDEDERPVSDEEDPAESFMVDPLHHEIAQDFRANLRIQTQQLREMFPDSAEEPSSAAGGRGSKRPASDPHKVKAEVLRLMQKLSKQERIALLEDLNSEKCPVCLDEYNNPEDAEKDPVLGECGHTVCKACEPRLRAPKKCPSCRQRWKPAEFALLLV